MFRRKYSNLSKVDSSFGNPNHYYSNFYQKMMGIESKGLVSLLWKYPHRVLQKNIENTGGNILEVGAGSGEHLYATNLIFENYYMLDLDLNRLQEYKGKHSGKLYKCAGDATNLEFPDDYFQRLIATCLLAHLANPEEALVEWRRVVKSGGNLSIYIPCEPGLALRLFRRTVSKRKSLKLGFCGFDLYIARDHINDHQRLLELIKFIFRDDTIIYRYRPFPVRTWYLNLFTVVHITKRTNFS